jgi:ferredoxin-NADP reductase
MFISVIMPLADEVRVRPYTIATSPEDGEPFELCFNLVPNGPGATWMFERKIGDVLDFTGPFGAFTLDRPPELETVFIAEGTAIAPIRPMIHRALSYPAVNPIHLLYAAQTSKHLLYRPELDSLAKAYPRFRFEPLVVTEHLHQRLMNEVQHKWITRDDDRTRLFYVCGIGAGVLKLRDLLRGAGYQRRAVQYERW